MRREVKPEGHSARKSKTHCRESSAKGPCGKFIVPLFTRVFGTAYLTSKPLVSKHPIVASPRLEKSNTWRIALSLWLCVCRLNMYLEVCLQVVAEHKVSVLCTCLAFLLTLPAVNPPNLSLGFPSGQLGLQTDLTGNALVPYWLSSETTRTRVPSLLKPGPLRINRPATLLRVSQSLEILTSIFLVGDPFLKTEPHPNAQLSKGPFIQQWYRH